MMHGRKNIKYFAVLHKCEPVKVREEHVLWVFGSRIYRKAFRAKKEERQEDCRKVHVEEFFSYVRFTHIIRVPNERERNGFGTWHVRHKREMQSDFVGETLKRQTTRKT